MVGVLRSGNETADMAPTVGTDRAADLVGYLEGAGVQASLSMEDYDRTAVPAFIDVALFGIAREAVTNIVRHAGATRAELRLATTGGRAWLSVEDDGCGFAYRPSEVSGHGLEGMRERVRLLGGTFEAAQSPLGGFRIAVSMPLVKGESHG